jgi:1-aminocyclopropane-1-carboxylate deaminase/D-cysteine desulfhydrase-like pyridoxal-dependent ACC family enzyme
MGGNKARQLEFYLGQAVEKNADTILITCAVQSNYVRTAAAAARKMGMQCHIQLEDRVANKSANYHSSGNVLLNKLLGATLHYFPEGENEEAADQNLESIAEKLREQGARPYVIHLGPGHPLVGALGYVVAARETLEQLDQRGIKIDEFIIASGSGASHSGFLYGLRAMGCTTPVRGVCVRRGAELQHARIVSHCQDIARQLGVENCVSSEDILIDERFLAPGYGTMNHFVEEAISLAARQEGIILDPVYSGRTMAGLVARARQATRSENILFVHTGGQPSIFAYQEELAVITGPVNQ